LRKKGSIDACGKKPKKVFKKALEKRSGKQREAAKMSYCKWDNARKFEVVLEALKSSII